MSKRLVFLIAVVAASAGGYLAIRGLRTHQAPSPPSAVSGRPSGSAPGAANAPLPGSPSPPALAAAPEPAIVQADAVNVAAPEIGGHVAFVTSEADREDRAAVHLIDRGRPEQSSWVATAAAPQEVVLGFFERQPARISAIVIDPNTHTVARWAKDVEIWTSMEGPTSGFLKAASLTLAREDREQTMTMTPVEAKFVKIRILSQHQGDGEVGIGKIKVLGILTGRAPEIAVARAPAPAVVPTAIEAGSVSGDSCSASSPLAPLPVHGGSAKVLVLARKQTLYPPLGYSAKDAGGGPAASIYGQIAFTRVPPGAASPALLGSAQGFDTVVLSQVCDVATALPDSFKRALVEWVGQGHKLIIHDSDLCDGANTPDYGFLPYRFATSNPGKRGAESKALSFSEENGLGRSLEGDSAFLDLGGWAKALNELGDSNTVKSYDPHWCGHLVTRNVLNVNGFVETYAHYGRGLIIYDGFDYDQAANPHYRRLVTNELAQSFDPDGLPCSARLSDFVLTTEAPQARYMAPGQTYRYPVTLLSNQGYKGAIRLTAAIVPADPAVSATLDRDAIDLVDSSEVQLTVTTSGAAAMSERMIAVRGTDASGLSNLLCLRLAERKSGSLRVTTDLARSARPTKNLEIILDLSGSMKLPLGKSTRIATARRVLHEVVAKIPDDFKVGLRVYGHRYGSRQKDTCTDSELVVPIQKLDRNRLLSVIDSTQPRGETPLVYSVLQTTADLKAVGGGSVILITDGEESCHGDAAAAASALKASGVDVTLQILGFTLSGRQVQQQLTQFAQAAGGRYYSAQDGETLGRALLMAAVDKMPFTVFDAAGREVARGDTDSASIELAPGEFKVVVRAADQELVAEHVIVATRGEAVLKVVIKNDRFELQR